MAGLLTHLIVATAGFLIGTFLFKNWKYGFAFLFGHVIPDVIDFGVIGVIMGSANPAEIMAHPWFQPLAIFGHTFGNWIIFGLLVVGIILWSYNKDKISKKTFKKSFITLVAFLAGVFVHLLLDKLIIETSYWI